MIQSRPIRSRRPSGRWTPSDWAASITISALWHLMALAVLALAVHPFQLPDNNRAVSLELLPPLTPPETPTVDVQLRRLPEELRPPAPRPAPSPRPPQAPPKAEQVQPAQPQETPPQPPPVEAARPTPQLAKPVEVERPSAQSPRLQTQQALPQLPEAPPEPVTVNRPASLLPPPVEAPRAQAPRRAGPLDTHRAAPELPQAQSEAPAPSEAPVTTAPQVLTNSNVVKAPVEIRPRERPALAPGLTTQGGAPEIATPSGGGGAAAPGGQAGDAAAGGGQAGGLKPFAPINGGVGLRGLRTDLGCENPDAYKLSAEDRAACLQRFGQRAKSGPDLGPNISARKQAEYDHYQSCHQAVLSAGIPNSNGDSAGTSIRGLGAMPSLKDCGPSTR